MTESWGDGEGGDLPVEARAQDDDIQSLRPTDPPG
jgi:hypothetical protein